MTLFAAKPKPPPPLLAAMLSLVLALPSAAQETPPPLPDPVVSRPCTFPPPEIRHLGRSCAFQDGGAGDRGCDL